jgi:hypothetical protein
MSFIRSLMAGLGGIGGFLAWYVVMRTTGLWSSFLVALYSEQDKTVIGFVGSLLLSWIRQRCSCVICG